ncbi:MAG TPA: phospholipase D-like domain-containing protein, partial [Acetobacteraceae bacterium]
PFDHAKLMTVDGAWCLIGSANWDLRSLRLNFELNLEIRDDALAGAIDAHIQARARIRLTARELDHRPLPLRLRDAAARLAQPYL